MALASPDPVLRKIESLPDEPGVYLWKDRNGTVLYVGKAKRLRQRVRSYVTSDGTTSPTTRALRRLIADLDTIVVPSEPQALLLENNLIKEYRPRFNIRLRDDKSYPSIAVTLAEPFPRVLVVRRISIPGARYFGPYTDVAVLRHTLQIIRRLFTVRSCHYRLPDEAPDRPCLDYHIDRCLAPCVGFQDQASYRSMIEDVIAFLEGKTIEVRARLRERMDHAATQLNFERAASIRDAIKWLEQLERPQSVEFVGGGDADALGFARDGDDAIGVILRVRDGKVIAREERFLENVAHQPDAEILSAFLVRHYLPADERARRAILPFAAADFESLTALTPDTQWVIPQRGIKRRLVDLADQNARHLLESFKIESLETDERAEDPVYAVGRDLGLSVVPRSMICIDISTNQGRDTVGSLVWFEAGRPKKSEYRRFKIAGNGVQDDFAAIREVLTRYLTKRREEERPFPDLILIDGGKGQLGAAAEVLRQQEAEIPLASLAKRDEEVFLPGRKSSLRLSPRAPSLRLLQRARDEAHRFAIAYSRKRRAARTVTSELMNIPGIGERRRRALLERFGSLAGVRLATPEEIRSVPGLSGKLADRILRHLST